MGTPDLPCGFSGFIDYNIDIPSKLGGTLFKVLKDLTGFW
jgi:hypothetical protein